MDTKINQLIARNKKILGEYKENKKKINKLRCKLLTDKVIAKCPSIFKDKIDKIEYMYINTPAQIREDYIVYLNGKKQRLDVCYDHDCDDEKLRIDVDELENYDNCEKLFDDEGSSEKLKLEIDTDDLSFCIGSYFEYCKNGVINLKKSRYTSFKRFLDKCKIESSSENIKSLVELFELVINSYSTLIKDGIKINLIGISD